MGNDVKHYWPEEIVGTGELVVYLQDYDALEAENARLAEDVKKWQALAQNVETLERITESAEARSAQFAAIQGGMGAPDITTGRGYPAYSVEAVQRIAAAMAAEVADAKSARDAYGQNALDMQAQRDALAAELQALKAPCSKAPEVVERFRPTTTLPYSDRASDVEAYMCEDDFGEYMTVAQHERIVAALKAQIARPVGYQYQGRDGEWRSFIDQRHYENTVAAGTWPIRAIYATLAASSGQEKE